MIKEKSGEWTVSEKEQKMMVKAASLYYHDGWTQAQISKQIGVSRPIVSRLLQRAEDIGIVEVFIKDETLHTVELEHQLEQRYGLEEAVVVPKSHAHGTSMKSAVAAAAALYAAKKSKSVTQLGVSWGTTMAELIKHFPYESRPDLHIVPLEGGMGRDSIDIHANHLAYELAKKTRASCSYLYAPAIVDSEDMKHHFMAMNDIKEVLQEGAAVEMALIGVGNPHEESTLEKVGYLNPADAASLKEAGAAGDVGFRFFGDDGTAVEHPFNHRVVGVSLDQLKNVPLVIAAADGTYKLRSIRGLLKSGIVNVLVIDEPTAALLAND